MAPLVALGFGQVRQCGLAAKAAFRGVEIRRLHLHSPSLRTCSAPRCPVSDQASRRHHSVMAAVSTSNGSGTLEGEQSPSPITRGVLSALLSSCGTSGSAPYSFVFMPTRKGTSISQGCSCHRSEEGFRGGQAGPAGQGGLLHLRLRWYAFAAHPASRHLVTFHPVACTHTCRNAHLYHCLR